MDEEIYCFLLSSGRERNDKQLASAGHLLYLRPHKRPYKKGRGVLAVLGYMSSTPTMVRPTKAASRSRLIVSTSGISGISESEQGDGNGRQGQNLQSENFDEPPTDAVGID